MSGAVAIIKAGSTEDPGLRKVTAKSAAKATA